MKTQKVYLDNAATTKPDPQVRYAMDEVLKNFWGNPSSSHEFGKNAKELITNSREIIAKTMECTPEEIIFTSGGTEADNLAIRSAIEEKGISHAITSPIEHDAVRLCLKSLENEGKVKIHYVNILGDGHIDLNHVEELAKSFPSSLVALMKVNNEVGSILNTFEVGKICERYKALFHCDCVAAFGYNPIHVEENNFHYAAVAAHKFYGPKGVGFLYKNKKAPLKKMIIGGRQENDFRGSTENVPGIIGMATAVKMANLEMVKWHNHFQSLKNYFVDELQNNFNDFKINGKVDGTFSPKILNVSLPLIPHLKNKIIQEMNARGIACSGGSACSGDLSHVLQHISTSEGRTNIRFSFSKYNTVSEIDYVIENLIEIYAKVGTF